MVRSDALVMRLPATEAAAAPLRRLPDALSIRPAALNRSARPGGIAAAI
jgi:hypothetical protein